VTQKNYNVGSNRFMVIGITFAVGLVIGVLTVITIQSFILKSELQSYDFAEIGTQQDPTEDFDRDSTATPIGVEHFEEIFKLRRPAEQFKALYNTLSHTTEPELKEWWIQSQKLERTSHREIAQQVILQNLAKINPQVALQLLEDVSTLQWDALSRTIFSEWAVLHLDDAIEAAASLVGARRNFALEAILRARDDLSDSERRAIAAQLERDSTYDKFISEANALQNTTDPGESWDILLNDNIDDARQMGALVMVAEKWREQIGFEVFSKIYHSEIEDFWIKNYLTAAIAQTAPALALDYAKGMSDEWQQSSISLIIVEEWASIDPLAALAAVSSFKPSSLYFELEGTVGAFWAKNKPYELIQNIELLSQGSRIWALEVAFSYIAREDPLEAIESLSAIENFVGNTTSILQRIIDEWGMLAPDAATHWLLNDFDYKDPLLLHSLLEEVLPSLARQDPIKAFEIALQQPNPVGRFGLAGRVISQLIGDGEFEIAISLLLRMSEHDQIYAYEHVGRTLVNKGRTSEALELGSDLEPEQQQEYYRTVFQVWARTDPTDLYESLEDLPSSAVQSIAASELLTKGFDYSQLFTETQLERARSFLTSDDKNWVQMMEEFERLEKSVESKR